ncbi:MAG: HNH endonuclease [bacterium]
MNEPKLFCSEACSDEAKFVRYVRRCRKDGREWDPDVNEAIKIRLAFILGGGYPEQKRQLSSSIRAAVIARDNERCQKCGQPGDQIDHIRGSSNSLENLQLLCRFCHNLKTKASMVTITPDSPQWEKCNAKKNALMKRIDAKKTKRACDDDEAWPSAWRSYWRKRKQIFSELSKKAKTIRRQ